MQQHLYSLIKKYKEQSTPFLPNELVNYFFKDGYIEVLEKNKVLKPNYVWSIYKKGQQRDNRISSRRRTYSNIKLMLK